MSRLRTAYVVQARVLGFMGLSTEAMQSYDKMVAVSENYWHAHPDDERAFVALTNAYNNSALIDDPRLSEIRELRADTRSAAQIQMGDRQVADTQAR